MVNLLLAPVISCNIDMLCIVEINVGKRVAAFDGFDSILLI